MYPVGPGSLNFVFLGSCIERAVILPKCYSGKMCAFVSKHTSSRRYAQAGLKVCMHYRTVDTLFWDLFLFILKITLTDPTVCTIRTSFMQNL